MTRSSPKTLRFGRIALISLGVGMALAIAPQLVHLQTLLQTALIWVKNLGAIGVVAFVVLYNLATILFIPGALLTLGGGILYGVVWGSIYVVVAATLGATLAFLIGRYCARNWVSQWLQTHPKFRAIDTAVAKDGLKIVLLTRLSPIIPFNLLNYMFGVTCVSLKDYILGSVGMVPGTLLYVYMGSLIGDIALLGFPQPMSLHLQLLKWLTKLIGFLATIAITLYINHITKRWL